MRQSLRLPGLSTEADRPHDRRRRHQSRTNVPTKAAAVPHHDPAANPR
jgi:hypothetical protein